MRIAAAFRSIAPFLAAMSSTATKRSAACMSMSASEFIADVNTRYEALHRAFEEQFWGTKVDGTTPSAPAGSPAPPP